MQWMIRDTVSGKYSNGVIQLAYNSTCPYVKWSNRGKQWTQEKYLKEHILKYAQLSSDGQCPVTWEVVEIIEKPTKPINDWIDVEMVMKLLKKVKK